MVVIPTETEALIAYAVFAGEWSFALAHVGIVTIRALVFNVGVVVSVVTIFLHSLAAYGFLVVKKKSCEVLACEILIINFLIIQKSHWSKGYRHWRVLNFYSQWP